MTRSMIRFRPTFCFVAAVLAVAAAHIGSGAADDSLDALATKAAAASLREFVELLSIRNVSSASAPDMERNARFLDAAFRKRGFNTTLYANNGRPVVFAEMPNPRSDRKTILFYMHMDGQPVIDSEWDQKSPFDPALKQRTADGRWETLSLDRLYGDHVDPEWRLFARSSGDDKGPILMFLAALDALHASGRDPGINVKVILDPEEESGGARGFRSLIAERPSLLAADGLVVFDGPQGEDNQPLIAFGYRGGVTVQLTVFGAKAEVHSGNYGNYAPNPMHKLARLVGNMKDDDGRVTIPGYYDRVTIDAEARALLAKVPASEEPALNVRLGIAAREQIGSNLREALMYPTLTLTRMVGGALDKTGKVVPAAGAVIPAVATATIAIRTVPETPPEFFREIFTTYVQAQGYHLISGEPTDADRARYRNLASLTVSGRAGVRTKLDDPLGMWLRRASVRAFAREPNVIPMLGASLPIDAAIEALKIPFAIAPLANGDDNQHTANENLRLGHYFAGTKSILFVLLEPFP
jgi:acetylornithine deacetylase/succinyl-diaminopimelate desuccinylase-like protein